MSRYDHKQCIHCSVKSCAYNDAGQYCQLSEIQVAPCTGGCSGRAEDESLCASYACKQC